MTECDEMYEKTSSHVPVLEKGCCPLSALLLAGLSGPVRRLFADSFTPHFELLVPGEDFVFIIHLPLYLTLLVFGTPAVIC